MQRGMAVRQVLKIVNESMKILIWVVVIGALFGLLWWQGQIRRLSLYVRPVGKNCRRAGDPLSLHLSPCRQASGAALECCVYQIYYLFQ